MSDVWTPLLWRPRGPLMPFIIKTVDGRSEGAGLEPSR